ncbi:MAG: DUF58 domain-containing protein [Myxococcota bacterium]
MSSALGVDEVELSRLSRVAGRLLAGSPLLPHGQSPRRDRAGRGLEFLDHRPYSEGDDIRRIDWRATARSRRPIVRRHRDEAFSTVFLCVDRSASMGTGRGEKWRLALQLAAALGYLLVQGGNRVGLAAFSSGVDRALRPARGRAAYARLVKELATLKVRPDGGGSRLESCSALVTSASCAVVISDFLDPGFMRGGIETLQARCGRVQGFHVTDPADVGAAGDDAAGPVVLRDVESGETRPLELGPADRERAARRRAELERDLARFCRSRGIPVTRCGSPTPWREAILDHLRTLPSFHASSHA